MYLEKLGGVYINAYVQWHLGSERSALFVRQSLKTYMVQSRNVFGRVFAYEQLDVRFDGAGVYRVPNVPTIQPRHCGAPSRTKNVPTAVRCAGVR